ncbi:L-ascorbate peroxidase 3, peroxisomal [Glycine soja]|nr:L-ascorbate peroxidase 3, peroxisomal [Glycine soja]
MVEPIVVDEEYRKEIEMARRELGVFITNNKCAPLMLQFAWNDAATYDAKSRRGGPNGSIRLRIGQELKHEANKGLENAVQYCEIVKTKLKLKKVSYADLYQDSNESPRTEGRFIDGEEDARNLRKIFSRMGLSDEQDIVALCGGHTLIRTMYPKVPMGETHKDRSKFEEGKSTNKPLKFDNSYFKELLSKDASFSRLPMDYALVEDPKFHHCVERYARTHVKLTGTIGKRWTIVIDVAKETVTGVALDLGPLPLDSPVVDGFEEGAKLVLLLELELGGVRDGEGDGALVAGFEVEVWRVGMSGVKIQVGSALRTAVHGGHGSVGGNVNCEASFSAVRGITK